MKTKGPGAGAAQRPRLAPATLLLRANPRRGPAAALLNAQPPPRFPTPSVTPQGLKSPRAFTAPLNTPLTVPAAEGLLIASGGTAVTTSRRAVLDPPLPAAAGTISVGADGGFTFTPAAGVMGSFTFGFKAVSADGTTSSAPASATITVGALWAWLTTGCEAGDGWGKREARHPPARFQAKAAA
jgi:hypothetical protein